MGFATPWLLVGLAALPVLWWLLRATPPTPRRLTFPAIQILLPLINRRQTAARTPPWLMALRLTLAALVIVGAAHPLLRPAAVTTDQPLLLVIDNGWAAAPLWQNRRNQLLSLLAQTDPSRQRVAVLATAPPADGGAIGVIGPMTAGDARKAIDSLAPLPWASDRRAAQAALATIKAPWQVYWVSDGMDEAGAADFGHALTELGALTMIRARPSIKQVVAVADAGQQLDVRLERTPMMSADLARPEAIIVRAVDGAGRLLARLPYTMPAGQHEGHAMLDLPTELRNQASRIDLESEESVGATFLLDDRWRRRTVGLADSGAAGASPLLDDLYYTARAVTPIAELRRAPLADLIAQAPALIVVPDSGRLSDTEIGLLKAWIARGGVLLRLAGPKLASNTDELLPEGLRESRMLGGAMSWEAPQPLAPMPAASPFAGLAIPPDVRVRTQILAEPGPDLDDRVWARLVDGTPLITGRALGKGWLVLIHTTIGPAWSDLGLSGLYPQILSRLIALAQGMTTDAAGLAAPPDLLLDGFAHLGPPTSAALPLPAVVPGAPPTVVGPRHPPGFYGRAAGERRALNLDPGTLAPLETPSNASAAWLADQAPQRDLQGWFFGLALLLLLLDMLVMRRLQGRLSLPLRGVLGLAILLALAGAPPARAESSPPAALQTRLAYVTTGDHAIDSVSRNGLSGLTAQVNRRTTAQLADPQSVDIERDPLILFPLLYWPVSPGQNPPSEAARARINQYLSHGGIILFDSRDRGAGGPAPLRRLTAGLDIPPLTPITNQHVLSRTFYLLNDFPGRYGGQPVFVEDSAAAGNPPDDPTALTPSGPSASGNDNVSPIVAGGNDWAAAWAVDAAGHGQFREEPDDEHQRELAYRFGINLVMYALTGTYKSDQVHLQAVLDRMKR